MEKRAISGRQRLENIRAKARIIAERNLRRFMAGEIDWLPAWNMDELIAREFERVAHTPEER